MTTLNLYAAAVLVKDLEAKELLLFPLLMYEESRETAETAIFHYVTQHLPHVEPSWIRSATLLIPEGTYPSSLSEISNVPEREM